ncbi:MAG: hypothetical protein HYX80_10345 [Chloroflexi bacterium]|nr:hypothetical protein [Chloroflexota bacterium]
MEREGELTLGGIDYNEAQLEHAGTQIAEELNLKKVQIILDDNRIFVVEHDPVLKHHSCAVRTLSELSEEDLRLLLASVRSLLR